MKVCAFLAEGYEEVEALVLLAAYSTEDLNGLDMDVYSFYGTEDQVLNMEKYDEYYSNLPEDVVEEVYLQMKNPLLEDSGIKKCFLHLVECLYNEEVLSAETLLEKIKEEMPPLYVQYVFRNDFLGEE